MHRVRLTSILLALLFAVPLMLPPRRAEAATSLPIRIQSVVVSNGHLVAIGSLGNQLFATPLNITAQQATSCSILNLTLGPINLDLLGAFVQTSPICLSVTAVPGAGNLLGNLLCSVTNLLNGGSPSGGLLGGLLGGGLLGGGLLGGGLLNGGRSIEQVLGMLSPLSRQQLLSGLTTLLQGAFNAVGASTPTAQQGPASCPILNLSLGPVDLNLLGLLVHLDNCAAGPVVVTITAIPSTEAGGGLLGDLLCSLANLLNNPPAILGTLTSRINGL